MNNLQAQCYLFTFLINLFDIAYIQNKSIILKYISVKQ